MRHHYSLKDVIDRGEVCDLRDLEVHWDCRHIAGHSADVEEAAAHGTEDLMQEGQGDISHRSWTSWTVDQGPLNTLVEMEAVAIVLDMVLPWAKMLSFK